MKKYAVATERWPSAKQYDVIKWMEAHFGESGERWGEEYDFGLSTLWMEEDVYTMYALRWS